MIRLSALISLSLVAAIAGCSADVGSTGAGLVTQSRDSVENQILYIDYAESNIPMTAAELTNPEFAQAVQLEVWNDVIVAWAVIDGEAQIGSPDAMVAAWQIEANLDANGEDITLFNGTTSATPDYSRLETDLELAAEAEEVDRSLTPWVEGPSIEISPALQIDYDSDLLRWVTGWSGGHPGCI